MDRHTLMCTVCGVIKPLCNYRKVKYDGSHVCKQCARKGLGQPVAHTVIAAGSMGLGLAASAPVPPLTVVARSAPLTRAAPYKPSAYVVGPSTPGGPDMIPINCLEGRVAGAAPGNKSGDMSLINSPIDRQVMMRAINAGDNGALMQCLADETNDANCAYDGAHPLLNKVVLTRAIKKISAGEQFLAEYGEVYWINDAYTRSAEETTPLGRMFLLLKYRQHSITPPDAPADVAFVKETGQIACSKLEKLGRSAPDDEMMDMVDRGLLYYARAINGDVGESPAAAATALALFMPATHFGFTRRFKGQVATDVVADLVALARGLAA